MSVEVCEQKTSLVLSKADSHQCIELACMYKFQYVALHNAEKKMNRLKKN